MTRIMLVLCLMAGLSARSQSIKNTASFITYFQGVQNVKEFGKLKDSLLISAAEIKNSRKLSDDQKDLLKTYYDGIKEKTQILYDKIVNDLMNKEKRRSIKNSPGAYVASINTHFKGIRDASASFYNKYSELTKTDKGLKAIFDIIKKFLLPVVNAFINELLDSLVRDQLDKHLKPVIVLPDWENA